MVGERVVFGLGLVVKLAVGQRLVDKVDIRVAEQDAVARTKVNAGRLGKDSPLASAE